MDNAATMQDQEQQTGGYGHPQMQDGQAVAGNGQTYPAAGGMAHAPAQHGRDKIDWPHEVWHRIDAAVREEIIRSRVMAKFLPIVHVPAKATTVPADVVINPAQVSALGTDAPSGALSIDETATTKVNEIWVEVSLTPAQVEEEAAPVHAVHHQQQHPQHQPQHDQHHQHHAQHHQAHASTGVSLFTRAANVLANVEDSLCATGANAFQSALIAGPNSIVGFRFVTSDLGLLNLALPAGPVSPLGPLPPNQIVTVTPVTLNGPYQERTVAAVAQAFSILQSNGQYGPYALVLSTFPFADAHSPLPTTLITPAEPIRHLMNAGFYGTGTLPPFTVISGGTAGSLGGGLPSGFGSGGIATIAVTTAGSGYTTAPAVTISAPSGSNVATATATIASGRVTAVNVLTGGSGYTSPPLVTITDTGGGSGATATATINATGAVTAVNVTQQGSGYTAATTVVAFGQATATATVSSGAVTAITVTYAGAGYTSGTAPNVTVAPPAAGGTDALASVPTILYTGFVVSLGGNTMDLVRGKMNGNEDVIVRFEQKDANGFYRFRIIERVALRLKDITAVVQLQFLSQ
jgi:hypothetical protein